MRKLVVVGVVETTSAKESKMRIFAPRFAVYWAVTALAMCSLLIQLAHAADYQCITMQNPTTCANMGNSFCSAWMWQPGGSCDGTSCTYCNDTSTGVPNQTCVAWENGVCVVTVDSPNCLKNNIQKTGACGVPDGGKGCDCQNPEGNANCSPFNIWYCTNPL
jgi:hypothetical protein